MIFKAKIQLFFFVQILCIDRFLFCSRKTNKKDYEQKQHEHEKTAAFYQGG